MPEKHLIPKAFSVAKVSAVSQFAAILLSRVELRPSSRSQWVIQIREALAWLESTQRGVISSIGHRNWEMVTALASLSGLSMKILLPSTDAEEFEKMINWSMEQFDLSAGQVEFVPHTIAEQESEKRTIFVGRDRAVINQADLLIPVAIREGGNMAALIEEAEASGKEIDRKFMIERGSARNPLAYSLDGIKLNSELHDCSEEYLIHWTRTSNDRWPDERLIDFYAAIAKSPRYPRAAKDTLEHILDTNRVLASSVHMPGKVATVSCSAVPPRELVGLVKWRSRFRQMSFEPYGIGFSRDLASEIGIREVIYYDRSNGAPSMTTDRWLTQSEGKSADWRKEGEYRHLGDIDLTELPKDKLCLFCLLPLEAKNLTEKYGIRAIPFVK